MLILSGLMQRRETKNRNVLNESTLYQCVNSLLEHSVKCHLCPGIYGLRSNCPVLLLHFAMHLKWLYEVLANKIFSLYLN